MLSIISLLIQALQILVFADAILSWIKPDKNEFPRNLTTQVTDPLYAPIRAVLNPQVTGGFDLSPIIVLVLLSFMKNMLRGHAL